jgi:hypothetical protein
VSKPRKERAVTRLTKNSETLKVCFYQVVDKLSATASGTARWPFGRRQLITFEPLMVRRPGLLPV